MADHMSLADKLRAAAIHPDNWQLPFLIGAAAAELEAHEKTVASLHDEIISRQLDRSRLLAGLETLAQVRHIQGNAQAHMRQQLRLIDALLAGADLENEEHYTLALTGKWRENDEAKS